MSFSDDLKRFERRLSARTQAIFVETVTETTRSIVEGSPITGSPGQPVDTGALRASWNTSFPEPGVATISTNIEYAPFVEENVRGVTFRTGGPHSVKLTIAGFRNIVEVVRRRHVEGG